MDHRDPHCELYHDGEALPCWVGLLDHFLEYPQDLPPDTLAQIERLRDTGGEVYLGGGAAPLMVLKIGAPEEP